MLRACRPVLAEIMFTPSHLLWRRELFSRNGSWQSGFEPLSSVVRARIGGLLALPVATLCSLWILRLQTPHAHSASAVSPCLIAFCPDLHAWELKQNTVVLSEQSVFFYLLKQGFMGVFFVCLLGVFFSVCVFNFWKLWSWRLAHI